ncbi:MAG: molybdenum cofactor biosynthesis protein MoaE [Myxococcota bacterium]
MRFAVRLFAALKERAGASTLEVDLPQPSPTTVELSAALAAACPAIAPLLPACRIAVNQEFVTGPVTLAGAEEIALIPPVSGGSGLFRLTDAPIDRAAVEAAVASPAAGAVLSFAGTVRDHTGPHAVIALEYEAYPEMAERWLARIGGEISARWERARVAIVHRTGHLLPGETSVVIAVASPHRADAFEACRYAIERLKEDVPIWKKELRKDGSVWVGMGS